MQHQADQPAQTFVRDGTTWLGYLLMATSTFLFGSMGPLMPFMRADLHMNLTVAALHFSAYSAGGMIAGCVGDRVITKFGRFRSAWLGVAIICCAVVVFASVPTPFCTVPAALFAGVCASTVGMAFNSLMSDRFGEQRAIGITEANIVASLACCGAPLVVSLCVRTGLGWRVAILLPLVFYTILFLTLRKCVVNVAANARPRQGNEPLPAAYWAYWTVIMLNVACEWSMVLWSAEFMEHHVHLAKADAAASVSAFLTAMVVGRLIGRRLSVSYTTQQLLPFAACIALAGFSLFWLGHSVPLALSGLFITGLGISNFYPLTLASALGVARDQATTATARMSIGTGTAILTAPLALGYVADHNGMFSAYGIIFVLLCLCLAMVFVANGFARRHDAREAGFAVLPD